RISLFIRKLNGTAHAPEPGFGVVIAERHGLFVIGLRRVFILRTASSAFRKRAGPFQSAGMILRRGPVEQSARRHIVLWTAGAARIHQAELKLRFRRGRL